MPYYVHFRTRLHGVNKKNVQIAPNAHLHLFMIKLGNKGSVGIMENRYNCIYLDHGTIVFEGSAALGLGFSLRVDHGGVLTIGNGFDANRNLFISCTKQITIGEDALLGWNVSVRDSDGHTLIYEDGIQNTVAPVIIGNHVWICAHSHILKNTSIGNNCVLGYKSLLSHGSSENNVLWAGHPAKIIKRNISWDEKALDLL